MTQAPHTLLGFDYGAKRIGIAVGQALTRTATPLETIAVTHAQPDWPAITRLISTWQPAALVVGLPFNSDGSEHAVTRAARRFCNQLQGRYQLPVHTIDERLTSYEAAQGDVSDNTSRKRPRDIDKIAAQLILQTWLNEGPTRRE